MRKSFWAYYNSGALFLCGIYPNYITLSSDLRYIPHILCKISVKYPYGIYRNAEVLYMNAKEAVAKRIIDLCNQNNIAVNTLANRSGVSPSTVYSMLNEKSQNPGIVSLQKICDGLDISLREFFNCDTFDDIEQEIK